MKLTIALQNEMFVEIKDGNIEIEIPDTCRRDLWQAQLCFWLEDEDEKLKDSGYLRVNKNKIKLER